MSYVTAAHQTRGEWRRFKDDADASFHNYYLSITTFGTFLTPEAPVFDRDPPPSPRQIAALAETALDFVLQSVPERTALFIPTGRSGRTGGRLRLLS